jgi:hypothetical protein
LRLRAALRRSLQAGPMSALSLAWGRSIAPVHAQLRLDGEPRSGLSGAAGTARLSRNRSFRCAIQSFTPQRWDEAPPPTAEGATLKELARRYKRRLRHGSEAGMTRRRFDLVYIFTSLIWITGWTLV